jgi:hypothetical protein
MINRFNKTLLSFTCLLMTAAVLTSCDKNDDNGGQSDKIELLSFGPTGARHGDTLKFIGHNLDKVTSIKFTGNAAVVTQANFKSQTSELIKLIVPQAAERGYVTLTTPQGDIVTKTQFDLDVTTTVSSMTAQARPGENVTINGAYLNWVTSVTFARNKKVTTFVSKAFNQLVVKIPDDAETGPLVLRYLGTDSADLQTADTLKVTLPVNVSMSPNPVKPLTNVTITGTNLDLAKKIIFYGVSAPVTTFVSQSATQIVVAVPATAKKGKLILQALSGVQTTSTADLDIVLPLSSSIGPNPINLGTNLTITGTDLDLVKKVIFSGVAPAVTSFVSQSTTQLVVTVPARARDGKITLEAASGVQTQSSASLDILLPSITNMSPNPVFPATNLTITGTMLNIINSITFNNAPPVTTFVSQSPTQIVVTVPNNVLNGQVVLGFPNPTDTIQSGAVLAISGGVPPPTIALPIYNDAVTSNWTGTGGWVGGGWGGTTDYNNTTPVREGSKSCRINYVDQWGSPFQLGAGSVNVSAYTTFKISIYGGTGSNGKKVNIGINGADAYTITIVEGTWTDYVIPKTSLTSSNTITEILVKEYTNNGAALPFSIFVDAVGFN